MRIKIGCIKIGLCGLFIVASLGLPAQAAVLPSPYNAQVVNIGIPVDLIGFVDSGPGWVSNDYFLDIQPPGVDASTVFLNTSILSNITFDLFECSAGSATCLDGFSDVWASISGGPVQSITRTLLGTNEYFLRMAGPEPGRGFVVNVSAVPLPAAALLFLSGLAGFGLLSRGKKESTDTDMPLLAA